jgi:hypothetical protein
VRVRDTQHFVDDIDDTIDQVKHATPETLAKYATFLDALRAFDGMTERRPGVFYRKSKAFLHFHEDPSGLYADVRVNAEGEFVRVRVESKVEQSKLLTTVSTALKAPAHK